MGDLAQDTVVEGADGHYQAALSPDWEIWGPNGGYVAAVALRAAGAHSRHPRPASLLCHFLDVAGFEDVDIHVETLRESRRAESMRVSMTQQGRRVLEALVWAVDGDLSGLEHDTLTAPDVPRVDELVPIQDLFPAEDPRPRYTFFDNLEERPVHWISDWESRPAGVPVHQCWYRFRHSPPPVDAWVTAGHLAILVDTFQWPAAVSGHAGGTVAYMAPSLDLACRFHRLEPVGDADWLLVEARSPIAADGLVGGTASVWNTGGALLASGGQQMLCRPAPGFA
ncbi:MAG: thioesterase family protein [Acidimicrobiales bacterium]